MANETDNLARIQTAVGRARSRWLLSAMVNAGGRWAALPAGVAALIGIVLALAGVHSLGWLLFLAVTGVAGVGVTLLLTRRAYARPAAAGAPDWTLLLDRTLHMEDALPTMLESHGEFRALMETRVAAKLDPARERQAAPARHWGALIVALMLALMPLVFWRPAPDAPVDDPAQLAKQQTEALQEQSSQGDGGGAQGGGEKGKQKGPGPGDTGKGGGGKQGEVQKRPGDEKSDGTGGEKPKDAKPEKMQGNPPPKENNGGTGDKQAPPTPPQKQPKEDIDTNLNHVKPVAGDGDTREESRSHWVYDPDGNKLDGSTPTPRNVQHPGEKAVPRTKMTTGERKRVEGAYKKAYD